MPSTLFSQLKKRNKIYFFLETKKKIRCRLFSRIFTRLRSRRPPRPRPSPSCPRRHLLLEKKVKGLSSLQISGANFANSQTVNSAFKGHISSQECTNNTQESSTYTGWKTTTTSPGPSATTYVQMELHFASGKLNLRSLQCRFSTTLLFSYFLYL